MVAHDGRPPVAAPLYVAYHQDHLGVVWLPVDKGTVPFYTCARGTHSCWGGDQWAWEGGESHGAKQSPVGQNELDDCRI